MLGFDFQKIAQHHRFANEFDDLGYIGSGGFADVHQVRNKLDGKLYAAKIAKIRPSNNAEEAEERLYRALSEAKIHSQLSHSQILKYHGCWMELEQFTEEELAERNNQGGDQQTEFQMMVFDDSSNSGGIVFGSSSSHRQQNSAADKNSKSTSNNLRNDKDLQKYKEIRVYILSELCKMTLQAFLYNRNVQKRSDLKQKEQTVWQQNYQMALDLTKGLSYLHWKRILHRDIKLQNIVLNQKNQCKIIDFGVATKSKYSKTSVQERPIRLPEYLEDNQDDDQHFSKSVGTKLFSSPEQASSDKYDYRTDIFSLAMVVVLLFCTFTTVHEQRELIELIRLRKLENIHMPLKLKEMMFRCLGVESERPNLLEISTTLKQLLRQSTKQKRKLPLTQRKRNIMGLTQTHDQVMKAIDSKIY